LAGGDGSTNVGGMHEDPADPVSSI